MAFSTFDAGPAGQVYSWWEVHKLATRGVQRLAALGALASCVLLFIDASLNHWDPALSPSRLALLSALAACGGAYAFARNQAPEGVRPQLSGIAVSWALAVTGAVAASSHGGFQGALAMGLLPVLLAWPVLMPGGEKWAATALGGSLGLHFAIISALQPQGEALLQGGPAQALAALLFLAMAASVVASHSVESWRSRAANLSTQDWLTRALSRPALEEQLHTLCLKRQRSLSPLSLVMLDLDRFKELNATYGRTVGDEILELLVSAVRAEIRASDFIGRYGGDEFLLVLDECEGSAAASLLDRLRRRLSDAPLLVGGAKVRISFSAGIVSVSAGDTFTSRDLLRSAERALDMSKEQSRNRTSFAPSYSTPFPPPVPSADPVVSGDVFNTADIVEMEITNPFSPRTESV